MDWCLQSSSCNQSSRAIETQNCGVIILLLQGLWAVWLKVKGLLLIHHFQHALLGLNVNSSCVIICHSQHALLIRIIKEEKGYFRPGCHSASDLSAALFILTCILLNCWRNSYLGSYGLCHWAPRATLLTVCPQGTCFLVCWWGLGVCMLYKLLGDY